MKGENIQNVVFDLIEEGWNGSYLPNNWIDGALVCLYKDKRGKGISDNYCGITLLDLVDKVYFRVLLNRLLWNICHAFFPESQSSFKSDRRSNQYDIFS